jgi:ribose 5-phosphate isomerase B
VTDLGTNNSDSVDYPDFGIDLSKRVASGEFEKGILVCGTGIGMSIVANKVPGIRAALVGDVFSARMSKEHNNANVLVIGGRVTGKGLAIELVRTWLEAKLEGGRHQKRLDKITDLENES